MAENIMNIISKEDRFLGCLAGGAVGDGLGYPVEFLSLNQIRQKFGKSGVLNPSDVGGKLILSDDTQMTLFTAEGLIQAAQLNEHRHPHLLTKHLHRAYLRWLKTQGRKSTHIEYQNAIQEATLHRLIEQPELQYQRAPGNTCLTSLCSPTIGSMDKPINQSKGCGGIMRAAPVGLFYRDPEFSFQVGCISAAITHGHPSGYLSAGFLSALISLLMNGESLSTAISLSMNILKKYPANDEVLRAVDHGLSLFTVSPPTPDAMENLGGGWVGEEALSIAIYCASVFSSDFPGAIRLAVNHGGDSDSTGAITGNILGLYLGVNAIPIDWLTCLELKSKINSIALSLAEYSG